MRHDNIIVVVKIMLLFEVGNLVLKVTDRPREDQYKKPDPGWKR